MKLSINLASRHYVNQRVLKLALSSTIIALLLILTIQGNTYLQNRQQGLQYQDHIESLQEQLRGKLPKRLTAEELVEQKQGYEQAKVLLQRDAFRWTALFDRMEQLLPDGISLRSFHPDYDKNVLLINGVARKLENLQKLLDNLQTARFHRVYLQQQGEVEVDNGHGGKQQALSFSIRLEGVF
ncbi:MAG: PilN domain-containing protein [Thermodesulfobacteriota bacterium]|nr:PilN domain-containing protein [Thermodesulfobacteriota bacterium]